MQVLWTARAKKARIAALRHIAQRNPSASLDQFNEIRQQAKLLGTHPYLGRPGHSLGTRELVISHTPFVLIYRVHPNAGRIEIVHFLHTAQNWPLRGK